MVIVSRKRILRADLTRSNKYRQIMARAKKKKPKPQAKISGCNGVAINLRERFDGPNPYSFACSQRCRHPILSVKSLSAASTRHDDWIPEDLYKRYTETDSRPASPDQQNIITTKRSASAPRARSIEPRKCTTPEPETKQCQFHQRRVLILDLRRVKSVDAITRQNSITTGTSFDSTYADDDGDNRSSKEGSIFQPLSPRNLSVSRSTNRSALGKRTKKSKERSSSPVTYERSSSPKILEGPLSSPARRAIYASSGRHSFLKMTENTADPVPLPADFHRFLKKNYEIIEEIRTKIREHESSEARKKRVRFRGRFNDGYCSVDSSISDNDTSDIISATVIPKVDLFPDSFDTIEIESNAVEDWMNQSFDADLEQITELMQKYPLVVFSTPQVEEDNKDQSITSPFMLIRGMKINGSDRAVRGTLSKRSLKSIRPRSNQVPKSKAKPKSCTSVAAVKKPGSGKGKKKRVANESSASVTEQTTLASATINQLTLELYKRYYSDPNLQLTLPPLHSSVLTLLGQRPQAVMKQSPRILSQTNQESLPTAPLASGRKKLRRQGRKSHGKGQKVKSEKTEDADKEKSASPPRNSPTKDPFDDPHETQMSAMSNPVEDQEGLSVKDETESNGVVMQTAADLNARRLQAYIEESARSLHQVLDEQLVGTEWNSEEMKHVDENIQALRSSFQKYETKFKTGNMRMNETMWLSLPRTWSRTSATFGVPTDIRMLSRLTPLEYIQKYVFISEPRKLLYSLVFNRYRGMENPTGKSMRYKTVERALAEVLGRSLSSDESETLQTEYLHIEDGNMEVNETLFRPICAVAERIFGKYSLEDCNDCYKCLKYKDKDKSRCHQNQKDQIEKADLDFVASKIRDGRVNPSLASLLQTVFMRG